MPSLTLPPGTELGAYRIVELLGEGGIGQVYLADHMKLGRKVALKKLRREYTQNPIVVRRFFDEARAANQISHENIVEITDFIEDEQAGAYLIMELLRGLDLGEVIARVGPVPVKRICGIMRQVAGALAAAHRAGIVHRDLTPDNIFLTERGGQFDFVKLLDFGIAKLSMSDKQDGLSTAAGSMLGTPAYMSPEQALGRTVDYRTDIYAFGVILYELLTGQLPFDADTPGEFVVKHATENPHPPSDLMLDKSGLPSRLEELTMQCLEKEADARPANMDAIYDELIDLAREDEISLLIYASSASDAPASASASAPREMATDDAEMTEFAAVEPAPEHRSRWWLGGAALLLVLLGGGTLLLTNEPEQAALTSAPRPAAEAQPLPIAPQANPETTTIQLSFQSTPAGATVWREGVDESLGLTPFDVTLDREDIPVVFEFRKEGYEIVEADVRLDSDVTASVHLTQLGPVAAPQAMVTRATSQMTGQTMTQTMAATMTGQTMAATMAGQTAAANPTTDTDSTTEAESMTTEMGRNNGRRGILEF